MARLTWTIAVVTGFLMLAGAARPALAQAPAQPSGDATAGSGSPEVDPFSDESFAQGQREAAAQCAVACRQAQDDLESHRNPCGQDFARRNPSLFCPGTNGRVVNPFTVSNSSAVDNERCHYFLLSQAAKQAQAASRQAQNQHGRADTRELLTLASDTSNFGTSGRCNSALSGQANQLIHDSHAFTLVVLDPDRARSRYCQALATGCAAVGGTERREQRYSTGDGDVADTGPNATQGACMVGNVVVDRSCFQSPSTARKMRAALQDLQERSLGCLAELNPSAGDQLRKMVRGNDPSYGKQTEVCCGRCQHPTLSDPGSEFHSGELAHAVPGAARSALVFSAEGLRQGQSSFSSTLFHEMLHRIGMCSCANHNADSFNNPSPRDLMRAPVDGQCPAGSTRRALCDSWLSDYTGGGCNPDLTLQLMRSSQLVTASCVGGIHSMNTTATEGAMATDPRMQALASQTAQACSIPGSFLSPQPGHGSLDQYSVCMTGNSCGELPLPPTREAQDPVYGCQMACSEAGQRVRSQHPASFGRVETIPDNPFSNPNYLQLSRTNATTMDRISALRGADICRRLANADSQWQGRHVGGEGVSCPARRRSN